MSKFVCIKQQIFVHTIEEKMNAVKSKFNYYCIALKKNQKYLKFYNQTTITTESNHATGHGKS